MRVWCALNQKGGVGKTSLLLMLLIVAWMRLGKVCLIDLDPQRSAENWWNLRAKKTDATEPVIDSGVASRLKEMLVAAEHKGVALSLVDTPGTLDRTMTRAAAEAHLIIVPTRTSEIDLQSLGETLSFLQDIQAAKKAVVVVNCLRANESIAGVEAVAARFNVPVAAVSLRDRVAFSKALDEGRGISEKAATSPAGKEIEALFKWLQQREAAIISNSAPQASTA